MRWFKLAAEEGEVEAQVRLGAIYYTGTNGIEKNYGKAAECFTIAAEKGHSKAQNNLGIIYEKGKGVDQSDEKAFEWYQKAAKQGHGKAQLFLGAMYQNRRGVPTDNQTLEQECQELEISIDGLAVQNGPEYTKLLQEEIAVEWNRKAAKQGYFLTACLMPIE